MIAGFAAAAQREAGALASRLQSAAVAVAVAVGHMRLA